MYDDIFSELSSVIYVTDLIAQTGNVTLVSVESGNEHPFNITPFTDTPFQEFVPGK